MRRVNISDSTATAALVLEDVPFCVPDFIARGKLKPAYSIGYCGTIIVEDLKPTFMISVRAYGMTVGNEKQGKVIAQDAWSLLQHHIHKDKRILLVDSKTLFPEQYLAVSIGNCVLAKLEMADIQANLLRHQGKDLQKISETLLAMFESHTQYRFVKSNKAPVIRRQPVNNYRSATGVMTI